MSDDRVRLVEIRETPLDVSEVLAAVSDDAAGGVTLFVGTVRDHDGLAVLNRRLMAVPAEAINDNSRS